MFNGLCYVKWIVIIFDKFGLCLMGFVYVPRLCLCVYCLPAKNVRA